jgi:hypothetical protein
MLVHPKSCNHPTPLIGTFKGLQQDQWDIKCSFKLPRSFLNSQALKRKFFNNGFLFIMFFDAFFKPGGWGRFVESGIIRRMSQGHLIAQKS